VHTKFWWGRRKERPLRRQKPRREDNIKVELRKADWINLAQYRYIWRVILNTVIPFVLYIVWDISWLDKNLLAFKEGFNRSHPVVFYYVLAQHQYIIINTLV
jgi:hypothetical protein